MYKRQGGYIGFFGKASDGMVDIQLISDLHKSEVHALARHLDVPASVIAAVPTGDVFDGRTDEEMIGASYDFIELYMLVLALGGEDQARMLGTLGALGDEARAQFAVMRARLNSLTARPCTISYLPSLQTHGKELMRPSGTP